MLSASSLSALRPQKGGEDREVCGDLSAVLTQQASLYTELDQHDLAQNCDDTAQLWIDFQDDGNVEKRQCILQSWDDSSLHQSPHPWPASSKSHPNLDARLQELKRLRLQELVNGIYIPPQAKASLQASNTALFPLMDKTQEFPGSDRQVFLLLGDSGAGKSTFNRHLESYLWDKYEDGGPIPLHISLPAIKEPDTDMIAKQLQRLVFSETQIQELKRDRQLILVCDGYDEAQLKTNLHITNRLNQSTGTVVAGGLFQEAVIAPFSRNQINKYIDQYVSLKQTRWSTKEYMDQMAKVPNLMEPATNPFLLMLALDTLKTLTRSDKNVDGTPITRVILYDNFVKQWMEVNRLRLEASPLNKEERLAFDMLLDDSFIYRRIDFLKNLSAAIFGEQASNPVVRFSCRG
ncbi:Transducin (beta)-like 1 X-linked receptor 1 [Mortierella sp. AD031]|nr:Transducin (beta)-like 1 X-linked receptor 1 [Mortierella sp. AD031]